MARCLLALGSNLGDRHAILGQACGAISQLPKCHFLARSRWYATAPIGGAAGQGEFLNGAVLLDGALLPQQLATSLRKIEADLGRQRVVRWDARTIDIDMLLYAAEEIDTADLTVPHPRMAFRKFVLKPATEIAGDMLHPTSGWTMARLLAHLQNSPRYVVVTGNEKAVVEGLVSHLSETLGCSIGLAAEKSPGSDYSPLSGAGVEFPTRLSGAPPVIAMLSPETLVALAESQFTQSDFIRPALVIAIDSAKSRNLVAVDDWLKHPGLGPMARITAEDPTAIAQEAQAAVRCIWPDISS